MCEASDITYENKSILFYIYGLMPLLINVICSFCFEFINEVLYNHSCTAVLSVQM